ncbi:hypothetical protein MASR2M48_20960 [Spirochaetota bacterium]
MLAILRDHDEETAYCVRIIDAHLRKGGSLTDIAILYRTNAQSLAFERAFPAAGVPYRLVGALRFYEREEVKDALALLALASNTRDEVAFRRVANKPSRGIGEAGVGDGYRDGLRLGWRPRGGFQGRQGQVSQGPGWPGSICLPLERPGPVPETRTCDDDPDGGTTTAARTHCRTQPPARL